jgi:Fe2+ or Zn2+ uptake regulation protein
MWNFRTRMGYKIKTIMRQVSEIEFGKKYPQLYKSVKHLRQGGVIIIRNIKLFKSRCDSLAHRNIHINII